MSPRWILCALATLTIPLPIRADESPKEITIIKLSVEAKAAPKPALKYLLLPELGDMQAGNPIGAYLKCFMEQNNFYYGKEAVADREKWLVCPLAELPNDLSDYGGYSLRQADYAARLETPDWQLLHKLRTEGIGLLLPDVQKLRALATALKVRYRGQIKAGKFDEAVRTHQTMFALARHLGDHPTMIGELVGIAIASVAISPFDEMIQQPGCPNMYWAISQLPRPLVEIRKGTQGDRMLFYALFNGYVNPTKVWDEDDVGEVRKLVKRYAQSMDQGLGDNNVNFGMAEAWINERLKDEKWIAETRKSLIATGLPTGKVNRYRAEQVMFHDFVKKFEIVRDDMMKWVNFPWWQAEAELKRKRNPDTDPSEMLARTALSGDFNVRRAQARIEQRIALLQVVEALRLHAAENDGKLPQSLADIKVPLPIDPISGKPIVYKLEGTTGIVLSTPPKGEEKNAAYNIRYEVTIRK